MNIAEKIQKVKQYLTEQLKHENDINAQFKKTGNTDLYMEINKFLDLAYDELFQILKNVQDESQIIPNDQPIELHCLLIEVLIALNNPDFIFQAEELLEKVFELISNTKGLIPLASLSTMNLMKFKSKHESLFQRDINKYIDMIHKIKVPDSETCKELDELKAELQKLKLND